MQTATCAAAAAERLPLHLLAHVSALMRQDAAGSFPGTGEAPAARLGDWKQLPGCEAAAWNFPGFVVVVDPVVVVVVLKPPSASACLAGAVSQRPVGAKDTSKVNTTVQEGERLEAA